MVRECTVHITNADTATSTQTGRQQGIAQTKNTRARIMQRARLQGQHCICNRLAGAYALLQLQYVPCALTTAQYNGLRGNDLGLVQLQYCTGVFFEFFTLKRSPRGYAMAVSAYLTTLLVGRRRFLHVSNSHAVGTGCRREYNITSVVCTGFRQTIEYINTVVIL